MSAVDPNDIAIVGMAGRFPGARTIEEFWANLAAGKESIRTFTEAELVAAGVDAAVLDDPAFVRAKPVLEDVELFDAGYFGYTPREAELTDPQHRVFLEIAVEALERAGISPEQFGGPIGVFAGAAASTYLLRNLMANAGARNELGGAAAGAGNMPDGLATKVAYKLNLRGPAFAIQSACSTSLVAVHAACQSLLNFECDAALAGGVAISVPQVGGCFYQEDGIASPDGHCRAFDAAAAGTIFGSGAGVVVLQRLSDALKEGAPIAAVIRGSAVNNDGSLKAGFAAPSVVGQAGVIAEAQASAGVESAEEITYVEAHGTATPLGDPVEVAALTKAFRATTAAKGFCALGSVKTNIGHLDTAGGVAGLIKTVLALQHRQIPPSLHFSKANPKIDFAGSPFFVAKGLSEWVPGRGGRRVAGVSAFGVGGTNAHVVVAEAPADGGEGGQARRPVATAEVLVLSAKTATALEAMTMRLADFLAANPEVALADVAATLQRGRRVFEHRRAAVVTSVAEAVTALRKKDPARVFSAVQKASARRVTFMFPGQGAQFVGMGRGLYESERVFREEVDRACGILAKGGLGFDVRAVIYPGDRTNQADRTDPADHADPAAHAASHEAAANERLKQTEVSQVALFVIEYALAKLWMSWGVKPAVMIGHSLGEYVAACLAGVFSLEDALKVVVARGRLTQALPGGAMLAVPLPAEQVRALLTAEVSIALINTASSCVVAGTPAGVSTVEAALAAKGVPVRRLETSHAFHSPMMEAMLPAFADVVRSVTLKAPQVAFVSNVTGRAITAEQAVDPAYWVRQTRQTVYFADGIGELVKDPEGVFLEVGPGMTLSNLTRQALARGGRQVVVNSLADPREKKTDTGAMLAALARLWLAGIEVDLAAPGSSKLQAPGSIESSSLKGEMRRRVVLPTYPFERQRYWIEPDAGGPPAAHAASHLAGGGGVRRAAAEEWFYVPVWKQSMSLTRSPAGAAKEVWVVLGSVRLTAALRAEVKASGGGGAVVGVAAGEGFSRTGGEAWTVRPEAKEDYAAVLRALREEGLRVNVIVAAWELEGAASGSGAFRRMLALTQAAMKEAGEAEVKILAVTTGAASVRGDEVLRPEGMLVSGLTRVMGQEAAQVRGRVVDVEWREAGEGNECADAADPAAHAASHVRRVARQILAEANATENEAVVAWRGTRRWVQGFERVAVADAVHARGVFREGGVYLITGGFGGMGFAIAEWLAATWRARLVLVSRGGAEVSAQRKSALAKLRASGADVWVVTGDVAREDDARGVVAAAREKFGRIDGLVHAAGVAGGGVIPLRTAEQAERVLAPKVAGTLALMRALEGEKLDFVALCSSLTAITGGFGQADYCAANAFLDTLAWSRASEGGDGTRVVSINWDGWREVGMAVDTELPKALQAARRESLRFGLSTAEGVEAFQRAMELGSPQVAISTIELGARLATFRGAAEAGGEAVAEKKKAVAARHARPALATEYVEPRGEMETQLAEIWAAALGMERVGALDNFFDLGGDSLSALSVAAEVKKALRCSVAVTLFYEAPTVRLLAAELKVGAGGDARK